LLVENELYYSGWEAELEGQNEHRRIRAVQFDGALRAWPLPAGSYRMHTRFHLHGRRGFATVSAVGVLLWLLSAIAVRGRSGAA
jgi:hypothetical protein